MSKQEKEFFHYRNAFKSDHLASADVEELQENNEGVAILTITRIDYFEQKIVGNKKIGGRMVAGRMKDKGLVAFFSEKGTKPMIVNAKNSKIIAGFIGSKNVHDWKGLNLKIELYVNHKVKLGSEIVQGIRIKPRQPATKLPPLKDEQIEATIEWMQGNENNTLAALKKIKVVSKEQESKIMNLLKPAK